MIVTVKRTKQVAQFEPITIEMTQDIDDLEPSAVTPRMLVEVDKQIEEYISKQTEEYTGVTPLQRVLKKTLEWKPANMSDMQLLTDEQSFIVNEVKKLIKRTPEYKNRVITSNVPNEANRSK